MKRYGLGLVFVWTAVILISLAWNIQQVRKTIRRLAVKEARTHFRKDLAIRFWATAHGGVYVPSNERTPPNPHLAGLPERDIKTPLGRSLTLMNPAYMLRQMMDEYSELYGVKGRITSLKPFRAENGPDPWEKSALEAFDRGTREVFEFVNIGDKPYLRLIQPMVTEEGCLKCHGEQGYRVGDIRGGVGVSVPMSSYLIHERKEINQLAVSHALIFLTGMGGIFLGFRKLNFYFAQRILAEEKSEHAARRMEHLLFSLPVCIAVIDYETRRILDVNPQALALFGCSQDQLIGKICTDHICPATENNCPIIDYKLTLDQSEREIITHDGSRVPVLKTGIITEIDGKKVILECFIDITDKNLAEKELIEKEKLQVVLEVAGGVCHEFNQPLQVISGYCELLLNDKSLDRNAESFIRIIGDEASRMAALTKNLTNLTQYETKPYLGSKIADITGNSGEEDPKEG
ncbi:c-type heme family protein [Desulfospira joergensenii]|uniref:c-type heme family protein n=1 Tax=Desulfospira joergensenii TaxID=53329 RepID=UPI0003B44868|nr:DUF3365 domain-containing protein [Desulfospira joergensenii]